MKKLSSKDEIKIGTILIKFPLSESVSAQFKDDSTQQLRYQVHAIRAGVVELKIPDDEIPAAPLIITGMKVTGITDNPPVLNKTSNELLTEGVWWI